MPQSGKILLRFTGAALRKPPDRALIFETIQKQLKLPLTGLRDVKNGFNAFTEYERDIEALLTKNAREKLGALGLEARLPPKVKAQRSVICRRIDPYVGSHDKNELLSDIERNNHHLKVTEVIKFKHHTHVFKIEFETIDMAQHALQNGILCCHVRISPDQIKQEEYVDILMCFRCYKLDCHTTRECPTPDLVICSECSGPHDYKECTSETKKCINCKGAHRTMAMACPNKKQILINKKVNKEEASNKKDDETYSKIVQKTLENVKNQKEENILTKTVTESGIRAFIMVLDAHMYNIMDPGTYNTRINKTLELNEIAPVIFDDIPDSTKLMKMGSLGTTLIAMREFMKTESKTPASPNTTTDEDTDTEEEIEMEIVTDAASQETLPDDIISTHLKDIGVGARNADEYEVDILIEEGSTKKKDIGPETLKRLYKANKLKYKIRDSSTYTAMIIEQLIDMEKLKEDKDNITYLGPSEFRKIRNGPTRSPMKEDPGKKPKPL
jgi:hypothetical protein